MLSCLGQTVWIPDTPSFGYSQPDTLVLQLYTHWENHTGFSEYNLLRQLYNFSLVIINVIYHFNDFLYFKIMTYIQ